MSAEFPYHIFLSHSTKAKAVVRASSLSASNGERAGGRCRSFRLAEWLRADGVKVWFDEWALQPEVPLAHRMGEGSGVRAAQAFGSDWVQLESGTLRTGQRPFRYPLNKELRSMRFHCD